MSLQVRRTRGTRAAILAGLLSVAFASAGAASRAQIIRHHGYSSFRPSGSFFGISLGFGHRFHGSIFYSSFPYYSGCYYPTYYSYPLSYPVYSEPVYVGGYYLDRPRIYREPFELRDY